MTETTRRLLLLKQVFDKWWLIEDKRRLAPLAGNPACFQALWHRPHKNGFVIRQHGSSPEAFADESHSGPCVPTADSSPEKNRMFILTRLGSHMVKAVPMPFCHAHPYQSGSFQHSSN